MSFVGDSVPLRSYMPEAPLVDSASKARVSCCSERIAVLALGILSILFIVTGAALFIGAGWTTLPMIDVVVTLVVFGSVMLGAVLTRISSYGGEPKKVSLDRFVLENDRQGFLDKQRLADISKEEIALAKQQIEEEKEVILHSIFPND